MHLMASTYRLANIRIADTFARGVAMKRWITSTLSFGRINPPAVLEPCVSMLITTAEAKDKKLAMSTGSRRRAECDRARRWRNGCLWQPLSFTS